MCVRAQRYVSIQSRVCVCVCVRACTEVFECAEPCVCVHQCAHVF